MIQIEGMKAIKDAHQTDKYGAGLTHHVFKSTRYEKICVTLITVLALVILNFMPVINITAQGPYLKMNTVKVLSFNNATSRAYCQNGDGC